MDVKAGQILVPYPAPAHVGLVCQDEGGGHGIHRVGGGVVVVADGGDDGGHVGGGHAHFVQDAEGHHRAGLGVVVAVDHVADVVHEGGDAAELDGVLVVAQIPQQVAGDGGAPAHMGVAVLGEAQGQQRGVSLGDIGPNLLGLFDVLIGHCHGDHAPFQ